MFVAVLFVLMVYCVIGVLRVFSYDCVIGVLMQLILVVVLYAYVLFDLLR